jgi:hypothetical protein
MDLHLDDEAFVRAPVRMVYERLVDPSSYPSWWPGLRLVRAAPVGGSWLTEAEAEGGPPRRGLVGRPREPGEAYFDFTLPRGRARRLRLRARPYRFRLDRGLVLALEGDLTGRTEWWLESGYGGTIVHHLAWLTARRATADAYRAAARRGLWGLKDAAQSEVRERVGLAP